MDVLGVPFPMPLWVENEIDRVVASLSEMEINKETLSDTKNQLKSWVWWATCFQKW